MASRIFLCLLLVSTAIIASAQSQTEDNVLIALRARLQTLRGDIEQYNSQAAAKLAALTESVRNGQEAIERERQRVKPLCQISAGQLDQLRQEIEEDVQPLALQQTQDDIGGSFNACTCITTPAPTTTTTTTTTTITPEPTTTTTTTTPEPTTTTTTTTTTTPEPTTTASTTTTTTPKPRTTASTTTGTTSAYKVKNSSTPTETSTISPLEKDEQGNNGNKKGGNKGKNKWNKKWGNKGKNQGKNKGNNKWKSKQRTTTTPASTTTSPTTTTSTEKPLSFEIWATNMPRATLFGRRRFRLSWRISHPSNVNIDHFHCIVTQAFIPIYSVKVPAYKRSVIGYKVLGPVSLLPNHIATCSAVTRNGRNIVSASTNFF